MNNWCICWLFTHVLLGILIFKGLTARRLYNSFGVEGLNNSHFSNPSGMLNGIPELNLRQRLDFIKQVAFSFQRFVINPQKFILHSL
jgi:hypothetical protein